MKLDVNELEFDVCVPVRDVFGEPAKGSPAQGGYLAAGPHQFLKLTVDLTCEMGINILVRRNAVMFP